MRNKISHVPLDSLVIDCTLLADFLEDLPPGDLIGRRTEQPGYAEVIDEIMINQEIWGSKIGVTADDIQAIELANHRIAMIDARLGACRKLLEKLEETRAKLDDQRQHQVALVATLVDARYKATRNPDLLARYEKTRAYRSAVGVKAVKTRRKNAALARERARQAAQAEERTRQAEAGNGPARDE